MKKEIIINKDEAYSYDEISYLEKSILPLVTENQKASLSAVLKNLKDSVENHQDSMAVFFMPQETFEVFAMLQGDNSICRLHNEDIAALCLAFDSVEAKARDALYNHLQKKIKTLNDYLQQGKRVMPTAIQADNFSLLEL